ncbi:MAG TPA: hypothetical protein DDY98_03290 [Ruminococcaceae bacterium]|nr:hypothetical protein [Oscillospiraceae bacterium]
MTRTQKSLKNTVFSFSLQLVTLVFNFAIKTVIVKRLGIEYSGITTLFSDVLAILSLAELGFGTATGYALYRPLHENDEQQVSTLIHYYRKIYVVIAGVILAVGLGVMPFIHKIVKNAPNIKESIAFIFFLYVIKTATSYLFIYKATLLDANQENNVVSKVSMISTIAASLVEFFVLVFTEEYLLYLAVMIFFVLAKNVAVSLVADTKFPFLKKVKPKPLKSEEKHEIKRNVGALAIYKVCGTMQKSVDSIIISSFLGTAQVGFLANYRLLSDHVDTLFGQFMIETRSSIGNLAVSESRERQFGVYCRLCMLAFLIGNFIAVSLLVLVNPFIALWLGKSYLLGLEIPVVLAADLYIISMTRPTENFRIANSLFVQGKYRPVYMTVINIVLSLIFCKFWGIFGVLFATVLARLSTHVWYDPWLINKHVFHRSFPKYLVVKVLAAVLVGVNGFVTCFLASKIETGNPWLDFLIKGCLCAVVPNALAVLTVCRTSEFKELLASAKRLVLKKAGRKG